MTRTKSEGHQNSNNLICHYPKYEFLVVLMANPTQYSSAQMKRLVGNHKYEVFDGNAVYEQLTFPICQGTYFNPKEISIQIPLSREVVPRLQQSVRTSAGSCDILIIFVPAVEVGKQLLKYKNAILEYNPRNYLALSTSTKAVNSQIARSITDIATNDFAILNNGITIIADDCKVTDHTGRKSVGELTMVNPQIINGGQTAYTLSQIYAKNSPDPFRGKEVMLKIVQLKSRNGRRHEFISLISNATNQQNAVNEADRRSNNPVLEELQKLVFRDYGYFFERKRGEFFNGSEKGFMAGQNIINRAELIRAWYAYCGFPASSRKGESRLFDEVQLLAVLPDAGLFREVFFSYLLLQRLKKKQREYNRGTFKCVKCVNAFRYGRFAVVAAASEVPHSIKPRIGLGDLERIAENSVRRVLGKWHKFETFAKKRPANHRYFRTRPHNFDNYYKGNTLDEDVATFSW